MAFACLLAAGTTAHAQPMAGGGMPDLSSIVGRPLPDRGMPTGTVTVRVARTIPANAVAGVEVSAVIRNAGGDLRRRTQTTDGSGRAMFEGMAPGDQFTAEVTVDGEKLASQTFTMPAEGGIRTMLIAALGHGGAPAAGGAAAGGPAAEGQADGQSFGLGATAGAALPEPALPAKTLEVHLYDEAGAAIPNQSVLLGMVDKSNKVNVKRATSDAQGVARFTDLATGEQVGYAAIIEWHGMRLGTAPFAMPAEGGARAEIRALARTSDPAVMTIGPGARLVVQMREDTLQFLEMLPLENTSDRLFDPGAGALEIPLPTEFTGAQPQQSDRPVEVRQGHGIAVRGTFTPQRSIAGTSAKAAGQEVTFGFVLPYHGDTREFEQAMPNGIGAFTLITEQATTDRPVDITVTGPGVGAREPRELGGRKYWVMPVEGVPAGGTLKLTLHGLPSTGTTGRAVAGLLALALVGAAVIFGRKPTATGKGRSAQTAEAERLRLTNLREALFAELVNKERERRKSASAGAAAEPDGERKQLVARLERVYRDLAALDEPRA
jgi:hypothetical protein